MEIQIVTLNIYLSNRLFTNKSRKTKKKIKVSNSKQQIIKIFETQIESDIKTGWNKV